MADETTEQEVTVTDNSEIPADIAASMDEIFNREPETQSSDVASAEVAPDSSADENIDSAESKQETTEQAEVSKEPVETEKAPETINVELLDSIISGKQNEVKAESPQDINLNLDADIVGVDVKNALDSIAKELSAQKQMLSSQAEDLQVEKERLTKERNDAFTSRINNHFDKYTKDLPSIGSSEKLNDQQVIERKRIYAHADMEAKLRNIPMEQALDETVKMFKSVGSEKEIRTKLITDLNQQKGRMLNTPTRKNSSPASRTYQNEEEKIRAEMDEVYNKIGIET